MKVMGYHTYKIKKGKIGKFSKIKEEYEELVDAHCQSDDILILCELSDLYGAIESYISKWNLTMNDLSKFSNKTKSAFKEGLR